MDRTTVPTQEEVDAARTAWESTKTEPARKRAEALYRQLNARRLRETVG